MTRMRWALSLLVLGMAVALWASSRLGSQVPAAPPSDHPQVAAANEGGPVLVGSVVPAAPSADAAPVGPVPTPIERAGSERALLLRGAVTWSGAPHAGEIRLAVYEVGSGGWVAGRPEIETTVAGDGFRIDITRLVAADPELAQIEVQADHPDAVTDKVRVDLPPETWEGVREIPVRVTLRPALVVTGVLQEPEARPEFAGVVAAFDLGSEGPVMRDVLPVAPVELVRVAGRDGRGAFRVKLVAPGRYLLVAYSHPWRPVSREVALSPGQGVDLATIALDAGAAITGVVRREGAAVPGAWVDTLPKGGGSEVPLDVESTTVYWTAEGRLLAGGSTEADDQGQFSIEGLTPGPHALRVADDTFGQVRALLSTGGETVEAPAQDIVLELEPLGSILTLRVVVQGRPVGDASVQIGIDGGTMMGRTNPEGMWRRPLPSGRDIHIAVRMDGFEPAAAQLRSGAPGTVLEHTVELIPAAPGPELVVTLTGLRAREVERCWIEVTPLGETSVRTGAAPGMGSPPAPALPSVGTEASPYPDERRESGEAVYRVHGLLPGRTLIEVMPGGDPDGGAMSYYLPERRIVDLPVTGQYAIDVDVVLGGRLRVSARDEEGRLLSAECMIHDDSGTPKDVMFTTFGENTMQSSSGRLGALSPATVGPALLAGSYTLRFRMDDRRDEAVECVVKAGETTVVDVVLRR